MLSSQKCKYCGAEVPPSSSSSPSPKVFECVVLGIDSSDFYFMNAGDICHRCKNVKYWELVAPRIAWRAAIEQPPLFVSLDRVVNELNKIMDRVPYPFIAHESVALEIYLVNWNYYVSCGNDGSIFVQRYDTMRKHVAPLTFDELLSALRESREAHV